MTNFQDGSSRAERKIKELRFLIANDTLPILGAAEFDSQERPEFIYLNGYKIIIDNYNEDDNTFTAAIAQGDSIIIDFQEDPLIIDQEEPSRSWKQDNAARKIIKVLKSITGVVGTGVGLTTIVGSVETVGVAFTVSNPVGLGVGTLVMLSGWTSIMSVLEDSNIENYDINNPNTVVADLAQFSLFTAGEEGTKLFSGYSAEQLNALTKDLPTTKLGDALMVADILLMVGDWTLGDTKSTLEEILKKTRACQVLTLQARDIKENRVTLRGYVSPAELGTKRSYGFISRGVYEDTPIPSVEPVKNGNGGEYYIDAKRLKRATRYNFKAYYWDQTNGFLKFGKVKQFRTDGVPAELLYVNKVSVDSEGSTFRFGLQATLKLYDDSDISDWGLYYMDGDEHKSYSLKDDIEVGEHKYGFYFGSDYNHISLDMGVYVKYKNEPDRTIYSDPETFSFSHETSDISISGINIGCLSASYGEGMTGGEEVSGRPLLRFIVDLTISNPTKIPDGCATYGYYTKKYSKFSSIPIVRHYKTSNDNSHVSHRSVEINDGFVEGYDVYDIERFTAARKGYFVGTYYKTNDGVYHEVEERELNLVYNLHPKVEYLKAVNIGTEVNHYTDDYGEERTKYVTKTALKVKVEGGIWVKSASINVYSPSDSWYMIFDDSTYPSFGLAQSDGTYEFEHTSTYYDHSEDPYNYILMKLADGSFKSSDNSWFLHGTGEKTARLSNRTFDMSIYAGAMAPARRSTTSPSTNIRLVKFTPAYEGLQANPGQEDE